MSDLTAMNSTAGDGQSEMSDAARVVRRAEELLAERDSRTAREIVLEALEAFGRRADLLLVLADAEFAGGDAVAGRECLAEALALNSREPASLARRIVILRLNGFWREALSAVHALPVDIREDPLVRACAWGLLPGVRVSGARGRQLWAPPWTASRRPSVPVVVLATVRRPVRPAAA